MVNEQRRVRISKRLSLVLRHRPESVGLRLDPAGWVGVDALLAALARHGRRVSRAELDEVVATNDKRRYEIVGERIRANQGHSVVVELGLVAVEPPAELFHGTVDRFLDAIMTEGLRPGQRHDVHLSPDRETAARVGARRGRPVVLRVDAAAMHAEGHEFRRSANGVWLVPAVPPRFLRREPAGPPVS